MRSLRQHEMRKMMLVLTSAEGAAMSFESALNQYWVAV
jgi:hypothetical protein